jgi:hypothetical protein
VIWGVLQLLRRRITKWCTLSTASTKLSIFGTRQASSLPYFSLGTPLPPPLWRWYIHNPPPSPARLNKGDYVRVCWDIYERWNGFKQEISQIFFNEDNCPVIHTRVKTTWMRVRTLGRRWPRVGTAAQLNLRS